MSFKRFLCFHVNAQAPIYAFTVKLGMFIFSLNVCFCLIPVCEYYADLTKCFGLFCLFFLYYMRGKGKCTL